MKYKLPPKVNFLMSAPDQFSLEFLRPRTLFPGSFSWTSPSFPFYWANKIIVSIISSIICHSHVLFMFYTCPYSCFMFYILFPESWNQSLPDQLCRQKPERLFRVSPHGLKTSCIGRYFFTFEFR